MAQTAWLVQESKYSALACDGIRDKETIKGAPWSRIVWRRKGLTDPFATREAADRLVVQACGLGVPCQAFEVAL